MFGIYIGVGLLVLLLLVALIIYAARKRKSSSVHVRGLLAEQAVLLTASFLL